MPLFLLIFACKDQEKTSPSKDTPSAEDSASQPEPAEPSEPAEPEDSAVPLPDADGDGWPDWRAVEDPAIADCDDSNPLVTPLTERWIPAGSFLRGEELDLYASPEVEIWLSDYCIDVYEVSNQDFVALMNSQRDAGIYNEDDQGQPLFDFEDLDNEDEFPARIIDIEKQYIVEAGYENHPVNEIWRWSALFYCQWKGQQLPTEAQWEKAARGISVYPYPWGSEEPSCSLSNYWPRGDNGAPAEPCIGDTTPVGSYPAAASEYGIEDMAGNVSEWVSDWFRSDYYQDAPTEDPTGPESGWVEDDFNPEGYEAATARGGSHGSGGGSLRSWHRTPEPFDATSNGLGFRCVRSLGLDKSKPKD